MILAIVLCMIIIIIWIIRKNKGFNNFLLLAFICVGIWGIIIIISGFLLEYYPIVSSRMTTKDISVVWIQKEMRVFYQGIERNNYKITKSYTQPICQITKYKLGWLWTFPLKRTNTIIFIPVVCLEN